MLSVRGCMLHLHCLEPSLWVKSRLPRTLHFRIPRLSSLGSGSHHLPFNGLRTCLRLLTDCGFASLVSLLTTRRTQRRACRLGFICPITLVSGIWSNMLWSWGSYWSPLSHVSWLFLLWRYSSPSFKESYRLISVMMIWREVCCRSMNPLYYLPASVYFASYL